MPQPDWQIIKQTDFSGGVNLIDDPADLEERELSDARNVRLTTHKIVVERDGYTQYNSATVGASTEMRVIFHFKGFDGNLIPLVQIAGSPGTLRQGSTAFPTAGTLSTTAFTETASADPAFIDAMWGILIYTNGVDVPQTWEGNYGKCYGFRFTKDIGVTYYDFSTEVADEDPLTYAQVGGMDTAANGDWILVKSRVPKLTGFKVVMGANVNANAAAMAVEYWNGSAWAAVSSLVDGTVVTATKTLSGDGNVTFTEATTTAQIRDQIYGFWWRISVDAALSANVRIKAFYNLYNMQALQSFWDGTFISPDGFAKSVDSDVTYIDYTREVTDDNTLTYADLSAAPTATTTFYVKSFRKFRAVQFVMDVTNVNTTTSTLSAKYWDGAAWQALTISDGTSANSKTLAQTGLVTWTWPTGAQKRRLVPDNDPMWMVQFAISATLSASVWITEAQIIEYQDVLKVFKGNIFHKNRVFMWGRADAPNYLFYCAAFQPDVWTGSDAGYIGVPSGKAITACARFYNDLFIATDDEIYILQGFTPQTFGLLKISTGGVGVSAPHSVVSVAKMIYFMHSTGFYRFDGIGVTLISKKIRQFFDDTETSYYIPSSRYAYVQGRFNRVWSTVEWTVSKGSSATSNNILAIFDVENEGWWFDDIVAASLLKTESSTYQDLYYHGDYLGKIHRDYNGTSDNGTAISAYLTTRAVQLPNMVGWLLMFRGIRAKMATQSSGSLTVTYAASEDSSYTSWGTLSMVLASKGYTVQEIYDPVLGTSLVIKIAQAVKDVTFALSEWEVFVSPIRYIGVQL